MNLNDKLILSSTKAIWSPLIQHKRPLSIGCDYIILWFETAIILQFLFKSLF